MSVQNYPKRLTASGIINSGPTILTGFVVNSHTSGTVLIYDNTAASGTVVHNTITFAAGSGLVFTLPGGGATLTNGAYATIGGTADITFFWSPAQ